MKRLDGMTPAVEFRNASWLNEKNAERTLRFLTDRKIAFVMVDEPQGFKSSVPPVTAVTSISLWSGSTAATARRGRRRASPRPSASATCTPATSWRNGSLASSMRRPRPRTPTSS